MENLISVLKEENAEASDMKKHTLLEGHENRERKY